MKKSQKIFTVDNIKEKLKQAKALVLTDYHGLKVGQINQLRQEIKKEGGEYEVVKNTLLSKASQNGKWIMDNGKLTGPTAALWLYTDDVKPLKTLAAFIKKNELPRVKFGFWGQDLLDEDKFKELANLPGMEELRARLIGFLKSPLYRLTTNLNSNVLKLLYLLKAKGGEN